MKNQVLSVEQMKHLQELGVDTSKTKMAWYAIDVTEPNWYNELIIRDKIFDMNYPSIPTFTLQEMLEMIPESITSDNILYHFELLKLGSCYSMGYKCIIYEKNGDNNRIEYLILVWDKNSLTCAYEILCWLAENKHIGGEK
jgi:hypothetical protein